MSLFGRSEENEDVALTDEPTSPSEAVARADELQAMQARAELANGEPRPEWLPERYQTPEALADAYRHAEQKITSQSEELALLRAGYAELASRLDTFDAIASDSFDFQDDPRVQQELRHRDGQALLGIQDAADQATLAGLEQMGLVDKEVVQTREAQQQTLAAAENTLAAQFPSWQADREQVWNAVLASPELTAEVVGARAPSDATRTLANVYSALQSQQAQQFDFAKMKTLAQTASGAGNRAERPGEDAEAWGAIKGAGPRAYWETKS